MNNRIRSEKLERQRELKSKSKNKRSAGGLAKDEYTEIIRNNELDENTINEAENTIKEKD